MADTSLLVALQDVVDTLRAHAEAVVGGAEPSVVNDAAQALLAAAKIYDVAMSDAGGVVPVLFADQDIDDEVPEQLAPDETTRLTLEARWDFVVRDEGALMKYARQRFEDANPAVPASHVDEHVSDVAGALAELFFLDVDGFHKQYEPHGAEHAGSGYRVEVVNQTLWEMTGEQRDAEGL